MVLIYSQLMIWFYYATTPQSLASQAVPVDLQLQDTGVLIMHLYAFIYGYVYRSDHYN